MLRPELVTGPAAEPVSLDEAKKQLEISLTDPTHNAQLRSMIEEAREQWEHDTYSCCCYQTYKIRTDAFPDGLELPRTPISSITSIKYYDVDGVQQTLSSTWYSLHINQIRHTSLYSLPQTELRWDSWEITYVAGYSADGSNVPSIAKRAMLLLIGHYFENREMMVADTVYFMGTYEKLVKRFMRRTYP